MGRSAVVVRRLQVALAALKAVACCTGPLGERQDFTGTPLHKRSASGDALQKASTAAQSMRALNPWHTVHLWSEGHGLFHCSNKVRAASSGLPYVSMFHMSVCTCSAMVAVRIVLPYQVRCTMASDGLNISRFSCQATDCTPRSLHASRNVPLAFRVAHSGSYLSKSTKAPVFHGSRML